MLIILLFVLFNLFVQKVSGKVFLGVGNDFFFASTSNVMETQQKTKTYIKALFRE